MRRADTFEFTGLSRDRGWSPFLYAKELWKDPRFLTEDGRLLIDVAIEDKPGVLNYQSYDSRKEIGLVGLRNQVRACVRAWTCASVTDPRPYRLHPSTPHHSTPLSS